MSRLLRFAAGHRWLVLVWLALVSLLAAQQLPGLRFDVSTEALVVRHDPAWDEYQRQVRSFGSESITVVLVRGAALLEPGVLGLLADAETRLQALPFVEATTSLFNVPDVRNTDGDVSTQPYLDPIPGSAEGVRAVFQRAVDNPLVRDNLLSLKGPALAINLTLVDAPYNDRQVSDAIESVIAPLRERLDLVIQIGEPYVATGIEDLIRQDLVTLLPASMLVLIIVLGLSLRRLQGALVPALTAGLSVLWTLALMAWFDIPVNVMTSIVPALLVIIGSTEDVHLLAEYQWAVAQGQSRDEAIDSMASGMGSAILLTFTTTFLGFLSILVNDISLLSQFGLVAAVGLLLNFLITCVTVPVYLGLAGSRRAAAGTGSGGIYTRLALALFDWVIERRLWVLVVVTALTLLSLAGTRYLYVNNSPLDYFHADSGIRQRAELLHDSLAGMHSFSIVLETGVEDTFLKTRYLEQVHELQEHIDHSPYFDKSFSFADFVALVHRSLADADDAGSYLPDEDDLVREYMLFVNHRLVQGYINKDYSSARIVVRHNIHSSHRLAEALAELQRYIARELDPALKVTITGQSILAARAAEYMAVGQAKSLLLMVIIILGVVSLLFADSRAGILAVLPNLFPVVILFGLMGYLDIPLDTGTIMVAVIALGICVDDTVHFMSRYHRLTRSQSSPRDALRETIRTEATPIMTTSVALALGFSVLAFSSFVPVVNFGLLSALVMLLALLATFALSPVLLSYVSLVTMWEMLSMRLQDRVVNDCPLFKGLGPWSIKQTILASDVRDFAAGQCVVKQGEAGSEMFVILEGAAHATQTLADGSVVRLSRMGPGAVFGEIALVSDQPRTANVVAQTGTRVLAMQWRDILKLSRLHPRIASTVFRNLSGVLGDRLAQAGQSLHLRDELTGVHTRPFVEEQLLFEIERARRYGESFCVVGVTLAYVNDPEVFEALLKQVTGSIGDLIRRVDVFARWAGRSFIILLPRTDATGAEQVTGRLRAAAGDLELSVQVACFHGEAAIEDVIRQADAMMALLG